MQYFHYILFLGIVKNRVFIGTVVGILEVAADGVNGSRAGLPHPRNLTAKREAPQCGASVETRRVKLQTIRIRTDRSRGWCGFARAGGGEDRIRKQRGVTMIGYSSLFLDNDLLILISNSKLIS